MKTTTSPQGLKKLLATEIVIGGHRRREMTLFLRQFSTLLNAGVSIPKCLEILKEQKALKGFGKIAEKLYMKTLAGYTLSQAMDGDAKVFPEMMVAMVEAGEQSGNLPGILGNLSDYYTKEDETKQKIQSATLYPVILAVVSVAVIFFVLTFVMPTFINLFEGSDQVLPLPTKVLLIVSRFLNDKGVAILVGSICLIAIFLVIRRNDRSRAKIDRLFYKWPVIGENLRCIHSARISTLFHILLSSGVPLVIALDIIERCLDNGYLRQEFRRVADRINQGSTLEEAFEFSKAFPSIFLSMVSVGEQSGQFPEMMEVTAEHFNREVDFSLKRTTQLLEPILILSMALIVGFVVVAIAIPMFDMINYTSI